jgi:hypothetical protein
MSIEDTLRRTYDDHLGRLDVPGGDLAAARRTGARMRTRRRLTVAAAVVGVVAVALAGVVDARRGTSVQPSAPLGQWHRIPAPPLSPRGEAQGVWTGREVVVLGGGTQLCPPSADCASAVGRGLRDGAAYDPASNTWRAIPPAPVPVVPGDRLVVADGVVVLRSWRTHGSRWFTYEPDHNRWTRIAHVPAGVGDDVSAIGSRVYASLGHRVAVYDVTRFRWSVLPPDRNRPRLGDRVVTATSSGPVLTGVDATAPNDGRTPSLLLADRWDGHRWLRLPPSEQLAGNDWTWTGTRMVDPEPFTLDGGEVDGWGRSYPMGGTLDPATGRWGPLPDALVDPPQGDAARGWGVSASGGSWFAVLGQVYDDDTGRVGPLLRPEGAPDYAVTAVWAGDCLLAFGGTDSARGYSGDALSNNAWLWSP